VSVFLAPPRTPFHFSASPVPDDVAATMRGVSWRDDPRCPPLAALALLQVAHLDFEGRPARGQLVIAAELVPETRALFARLWDLGFPIRSMRLIDELGGSDDASMAADNCSAFNFRTIAGTQLLSQHALGRAIDINPRENPWLAGGGVQPPDGADYLDRRRLRPGMIVRPGPVVALLDELGWEWGGDWPRPDYHHLMKQHLA
jgi:poly-gamma-glutamate synthesis protein (capsule biosynthesis protein)